MPVLSTVAWFLSKAVTTVWGKRIQLVRCFQERLSELGMGLFVGHYEIAEHTQETLEMFMQTVISAYIFVISPCALLSVYGEEIRRTPYLDAYFSKYPSYSRWKGQKDAIGKKTIPIVNEPAFIGEVFETYHMPQLKSKAHLCLGNPAKIMELIINQIMTVFETMNMTSDQLVDYVNQKVKTYEFTPYLALIAPITWRCVHPTLDLDWTVIKSYIALLKTYRTIRLSRSTKGYVPSFIKDQIAKVTVDDAPYYFSRINEQGILRVEIPKPTEWEKVTVDTFGLKKTISRGPLTLIATEDSFIWADYWNNNYGSWDCLWTSKHWPPAVGWKRIFLKFPLWKEIQKVKKATLRMYFLYWFDPNPYAWLDPYGDFWVFRAIQDWDEATITWNNAPQTSSEFTSEGLWHRDPPVWIEWDVTSLVNQHLEQGKPYYGFSMRWVSNYWDPTLAFASREHAIKAFRPQLVIEREATPLL